jgi:amino acid adenylation domain-containing protein
MQTHVLEYLDRTVAAHPDKVALVDEHARCTFATLARRARAIADHIRVSAGSTKQPIAIYLPKSIDAVVACFGILASGNIYAPLDTKSPLARTRAILQQLEPAVVITDAAGAEALRGLPLWIVDGRESESEIATLIPPGAIDTDPAYIIHTSGSTGVPKGVVIPHRGIIDYIDWAIATFPINANTVIGNQSPLFFDNSTLDLYLCAATGATLVLIPETLFSFPIRLLEYVAQHEITFLFWVPSVLIQVANARVLATAALSRLTTILFAGEVMPNRHLNEWRRHLPHACFANLYGPTEITVDCTYYIVDREFADDDPLPIGIPCRNTDILILDEHDACSDRGELCVRGASLALGYWNDPEKTAGAFAQNPLNPHYPERIYRTGDVVARNERGELLFIGRKDTQIKHLGYRIELGEIELAAAGIPGIRNACVVYDSSRQEICMFYESADDVSPATLRTDLSRTLPKYMLPTKFHRLDALPKNANGKTDRLQLRARLQDS